MTVDNKPPIRWMYDFFRKPAAPRQVPLQPPPTAISDTPLVCVEVNEGWIPHLTGALEVLAYEDAWLGDETTVYTAQQQIEILMVALSEGGCVPYIQDIIITEECMLAISFDGENYVVVGDLSQCADPGEQGPQGEPGTDGVDGASVELRVFGGYIQWRQDDDDPTWTDMIALAALEGAQGPAGESGTDGVDGQDGVNGSDGVDGASVELRVFGGYIQWRQDDDDPTWTNLVELSELEGEQGPQGLQGATGSTGAQGPQGLQGPQGEPGDCPCDGRPPEVETLTDNNENLCAGAKEVSQFAIEHLQHTINVIQQQNEFVGSIIKLVASYFDDVLIGIFPIDEAVLLVDAIIDAGTGAVELAFQNPTYQEEMECALYCAVKSHEGFTESAFDEWWNSLPSPNVATPRVAQFIRDVLGYAELSQRFAIGALSEDPTCEALCTECQDTEEWCYTIDLTTGLGVATIRAGRGVYVAGVGIESVVVADFGGPGDDEYAVNLEVLLSNSEVTEVSMTGNTGDPRASEPFYEVEFWRNGASEIRLNYGANVDFDETQPVSWTGVNSIWFYVIGGAPSSDKAYATSLTIKGTGTNPFASSNC